MRVRRLLLPFVAVGATANAAPTPTTPPAAPIAVKVTLADVGLEPGSLDRTADPCVDFYQFACGGWLAKNDIPADRARWARFSELDERNKSELKGLLEEAAKGIGVDANTKKLGDYYASCMDTDGVEKAGLTSIRPLLAKTTGVKDAKSWLVAVEELHKAGIPVVFGVGASPDFKDSMHDVTGLDAAGLGLPDRDYFVKPELKDKVDAYRTHVGKMLALLDPKRRPPSRPRRPPTSSRSRPSSPS